MNPAWGHLAGVITTLLMLVFIGIWVWAWRKRHKPTFDYMAKLPMQDEDLPAETSADAREAPR